MPAGVGQPDGAGGPVISRPAGVARATRTVGARAGAEVVGAGVPEVARLPLRTPVEPQPASRSRLVATTAVPIRTRPGSQTPFGWAAPAGGLSCPCATSGG